MNEQETLSEKPSTVVERRPLPTVGQVKTFAQAMFTAKRVAPEIVEQRIAICRQCDKRRVTPAGVEWCRNCGCKVSRKSKEIMNLAAYEENLPKWGCKHPLRKQGKGWPKASPQSSVLSPQSADSSGQRVAGPPPKRAGSSGDIAGLPARVAGLPPSSDGLPLRFDGGPARFAGFPPSVPGLPSKFPGLPPNVGGLPSKFPGLPPAGGENRDFPQESPSHVHVTT